MSPNHEIKTCFGCDDHVLASHSNDEKQLRALITAYRSNKKTYEDMEKEVVYYLWIQNIDASIRINHINEQIQRLKKYWK